MLPDREKNHLGKGNQLTEDQPVVDHLDGRGRGQVLNLADEDGGHHQRGGQVHAEGCLKEERLEEGGGISYHHEEKRREAGGHHLTHDIPLQIYCHMDSFAWFFFVAKDTVSDSEKHHV